MTRTELKQEAKLLVANSSPFNVLEFGDEIVAEWSGVAREDRPAFLEECCFQAERVLKILGF